MLTCKQSQASLEKQWGVFLPVFWRIRFESNFEIKFCCFGNELFYYGNLSIEVVEGLLNEENTGL